ncbi:hypothetical protein ABU614_11705 [Lysobacter firmicutimachus]|uniref:NodB homology domain-containing protein n=1 Tax=Lysobacter firmicutimachus TaxID=1792846 RepID=A0AAU8MPA5_9GAMM
MRLTVRFDVDTWSCAHRGMPFLMDFAQRLEAKFCFMVNMGRAVSRGLHLRKLVRSPSPANVSEERVDKLGSMQRMGVSGYLRTALLNPEVGLTAGAILQRAGREGHVLGLHGGRNHGEWQWGAQNWSGERLRDEVLWGLRAFERVGLEHPRRFSSPGWNSPSGLPAVLAQCGFEELHDRHEPGIPIDTVASGGILREINTAFAGEPGGVGYFESCLVRGVDAASAAERIVSKLRSGPAAHAVVYDHPVFCAGIGRDLFCSTLLALRERGVGLIGYASGKPA